MEVAWMFLPFTNVTGSIKTEMMCFRLSDRVVAACGVLYASHVLVDWTPGETQISDFIYCILQNLFATHYFKLGLVA